MQWDCWLVPLVCVAIVVWVVITRTYWKSPVHWEKMELDKSYFIVKLNPNWYDPWLNPVVLQACDGFENLVIEPPKDQAKFLKPYMVVRKITASRYGGFAFEIQESPRNPLVSEKPPNIVPEV